MTRKIGAWIGLVAAGAWVAIEYFGAGRRLALIIVIVAVTGWLMIWNFREAIDRPEEDEDVEIRKKR
jgi:hypothetical protein